MSLGASSSARASALNMPTIANRNELVDWPCVPGFANEVASGAPRLGDLSVGGPKDMRSAIRSRSEGCEANSGCWADRTCTVRVQLAMVVEFDVFACRV